jgi:hypothetical protein
MLKVEATEIFDVILTPTPKLLLLLLLLFKLWFVHIYGGQNKIS